MNPLAGSSVTKRARLTANFEHPLAGVLLGLARLSGGERAGNEWAAARDRSDETVNFAV